MKWVPKPYQPPVVERLERDREVAAFMDMGLGKTVTVLTAFQRLRRLCMVRAMLVLGPIRVVEDVWPEELKKWDHLKGLTYSIQRGSPISRAIQVHDRELGVSLDRMSKSKGDAALQPGFDIYLVNYEILPYVCQWMSKQKRLPWDLVVFDESTKMKSPKARRFKLLKPHLGRFDRKVILSGTPAPRSYMDLWAQFYLLDEGATLGEYVSHFKDRYFTSNPYTYEVKIKDGAAAEIEKRIQPKVVCLRAKDHLKLPDLLINDIWITLPPALRKAYDTLERDLFLQVREIGIEAGTAAALTNKCRQFTSGAVYETAPKGKQRTAHLHELKLEAVDSIVEEASGEPVLIVYDFRSELELLRKRWPKAPWLGGGGKDASQVIRDWNAGKLPVMFAHPASVAHGVNLQAGGRIMAWTSGTWDLEAYLQMIGRLHRQGQTKGVRVHRVWCRDTVDEDVRNSLAAKGFSQSGLLGRLARKFSPCAR